MKSILAYVNEQIPARYNHESFRQVDRGDLMVFSVAVVELFLLLTGVI